MTVVLSLDGVDAITYGVFLSGTPDGYLDAPEVRHTLAEFAGGIGGVIGRSVSHPMRAITLPLSIAPNTGGVTARESAESWLKAMLDQTITLRIDAGGQTREIDGRVQGVRITPVHAVGTITSRASLRLLCPDPYWRSVLDTTETISGTANTLDLGTGKVRDWVLTITATTSSITNITVTLGPNTLTWTGTIAAGQALVIDAGAFTVKNNGVDVIASYSGGFPVIDPATTPTVSATKASGSGTLGGSLVYHKRWS